MFLAEAAQSVSTFATCEGTLLINILSDSMAYTRGSSDDYDRFARVSGDPGWSWENVQKYIRMVRDFLDVQVVSQMEFNKYCTARTIHSTC
jgi:choline dehydrogenase-like flavoprotein